MARWNAALHPRGPGGKFKKKGGGVSRNARKLNRSAAASKARKKKSNYGKDGVIRRTGVRLAGAAAKERVRSNTRSLNKTIAGRPLYSATEKRYLRAQIEQDKKIVAGSKARLKAGRRIHK